MKKRERPATSSLTQYLFPLGLRLVEGENYRQREAYEVHYLKDDEVPRYQFTIAVSLRRAGALWRRLAALLGSRAAAIVEVPAPEDAALPADEEADEEADESPGAAPDSPAAEAEPAGEAAEAAPATAAAEAEAAEAEYLDLCDVWMGAELDARRILREFAEHEHLLLHDGMIGFGALSAPANVELFLDDHKLIHCYARDLEPPERILREFGLPAVDGLRHFSDLSHTHHSLSELALGEDYLQVFEEMRQRLGLAWQDTREYT